MTITASRLARPWPASRLDQPERLKGYFASLPADRFPNIVGNVAARMEGGGEERFRFGLDMFIAGIATTITR